MGEREEAADATFPLVKDSEEVPEDFQCSICLDLIYKPVIIACGHMACFWCVDKIMNFRYKSQCAICRQRYNYFPRICSLLHHLLLKKEPAVCKRREKEVFDQEKEVGRFSPQFIECVTEKSNEKDILASGTKCSKGNAGKVFVSDVLCLGCKEILFRPIVLNCGHVFCEACMAVQVNKIIKCQFCECVHPGELPKVCWDFDNFLKVHFPQEYAQRWISFQSRVQSQNKGQSSCAFANVSKPERTPWVFLLKNGMLDENVLYIHLGFGCDACGVYPIIGKRYRCKDCKEVVGFDLCGSCYNSSSKLPGRFNQQHTADHTFILDNSRAIQVRRSERERFPRNQFGL